jgi:hypothetical protein
LTDLSFDGVALPLVIKELAPVFSQQLWIALGSSKARTTQANSMTLAESSI